MSVEIHLRPQVRSSNFTITFNDVMQDGDLIDFDDATEIWFTVKTQYAEDAAGTPVPDIDAVFQKTKGDGSITAPTLGSVVIEVPFSDTESLPNAERMLLVYDLKYIDGAGDGPWTPISGTLPIWPNSTVANS